MSKHLASTRPYSVSVTTAALNALKPVRYRIVRFYASGGTRTMAMGLTLEEAQAHCADPEMSSKTAKGKRGRDRTRRYGPWFDGIVAGG
jgi:hypothetical protein